MHPTRSPQGILGGVWQWTSSSYSAYPGYRPPDGAIGEYNGKFMCNQYVLRGGSVATCSDHIRNTYRNFFPRPLEVAVFRYPFGKVSHKMSEMIFSRTIKAPVDVVFDAFADVHGFADRVDGIERVEVLTDGNVGLGTRFRETRVMFGKEATEEMEFTNFETNQAITVSADSCGSHFDTNFQFQPQGDSTYVDIKMVVKPTTLLAKLMSPLGFLMQGTMKKMMNSDFDQIQAFCESKNIEPVA